MLSIIMLTSTECLLGSLTGFIYCFQHPPVVEVKPLVQSHPAVWLRSP